MLKMSRQFFRLIPFIALFLAAVVSQSQAQESKTVTKAPAAVEKVRAFRDGDTFTAEMSLGSNWNGQEASVQYFKDSIQVDVQGAFLNHGKQLIKVEDRNFKSVYATQFDATTVRTRFTMNKGISAKSFANRLRLKRAGSSLTFEVTGDAADAKTTAKVSDTAQTVVVNDDSASESMSATLTAGGVDSSAKADAKAAVGTTTTEAKAADAKAADGKVDAKAGAQTVALGGDVKADATAAAQDAKKVDTNKLPESEIPILTAAKAEKKSESNPFFRLITTMIVISVVLGAAAFGLKKLSKRQTSKIAAKTKINVLTNHHLGPKKNLMIVQVAGETLLIGVTDHNITMLKTLALIDDEVPAELPQQFNHSMEDFIDEDESYASQAVAEIRDTVSARMKNLRNL